jgi:hypothetical protein
LQKQPKIHENEPIKGFFCIKNSQEVKF